MMSDTHFCLSELDQAVCLMRHNVYQLLANIVRCMVLARLRTVVKVCCLQLFKTCLLKMVRLDHSAKSSRQVTPFTLLLYFIYKHI